LIDELGKRFKIIKNISFYIKWCKIYDFN